MGGTVRVTFTLSSNNTGATTTCRIFKDGNPYGQIRSTTTSATFTEDIAVDKDSIIDFRAFYAGGNGSYTTFINNIYVEILPLTTLV
jgi:hypothetical protein